LAIDPGRRRSAKAFGATSGAISPPLGWPPLCGADVRGTAIPHRPGSGPQSAEVKDLKPARKPGAVPTQVRTHFGSIWWLGINPTGRLAAACAASASAKTLPSTSPFPATARRARRQIVDGLRLCPNDNARVDPLVCRPSGLWRSHSRWRGDRGSPWGGG